MGKRIALPTDPPTRKRVKKGHHSAHLAFVRSLPCALCFRAGQSEPHHLLRVPNGKKGMGIKNGDEWSIPLCAVHHRALHLDGDEPLYLLAKSEYRLIDGPALAAVLWTVTGNSDAAIKFMVGGK